MQTPPSFSRFLLALFLSLLVAPAVSGQETLRHSGGVILGGSLTYHLEGTPGRVFVLLPSTTTGPTYLPGGHVLDIGLDLLGNETAGLLDGATGQATVNYALPGDVALHGIPLYAQYVTIGSPPPPVKAVSNRAGATLATPGSTTNTIAPCITARQGHTATLLLDGRVLVAGGDEPDASGNLTALDTLEIYDPNTQEFTLLPVALTHARSTHTATLLNDGSVLLLGGYDLTETVRNTGDVYDPATGTVTAIATMSQARTQHTTTLLADGRVLVTGGSSLFDLSDLLTSLARVVKSAEIYDPVAKTWTTIPSLPISEKGIIGHTATLLGNGQVLVAGGVKVVIFLFPIPSFTDEAWRLDPAGPNWIATDSMNAERAYHGLITLNDGTSLAVGGADGDFVLQNFFTLGECERYDPVGDTWTNVATMNDARAYPNLVNTGQEIVVVGGLGSIDPFNGTGVPEQTIEFLPLSLSPWTASAEMLLPREVARAAPTDAGERVLIVGTGDNGVATVDLTAETYATE